MYRQVRPGDILADPVMYRVEFAHKGFAAGHVRLAEDGFEFRSPAFVAQVASIEFYQDPVDANGKEGCRDSRLLASRRAGRR